MATATISLTATVDGVSQTISRSAAINDAAMQYFFEFYRAVYGQIEVTDPNDAAVMRDMTDAETFAQYAAGISAGTVANVQSYVREQAAKQAAAAVPMIEAVPA